MSAIVECHNLTKKYRTKTVLNNFTATIEENTITGLIGRNGGGKNDFAENSHRLFERDFRQGGRFFRTSRLTA